MLQYGLTTAQIVQALNEDSSKEVLTTVESNGQDIEVIVQQEAKTTAKNLEELLETDIPTATGTPMPLSELVEVEEGTTLNTLDNSDFNIIISNNQKIIYLDSPSINCIYVPLKQSMSTL